MANPARVYFHPNLPRTGFGDVSVQQLKFSAGLTNLRRLHFCFHEEIALLDFSARFREGDRVNNLGCGHNGNGAIRIFDVESGVHRFVEETPVRGNLPGN